MNINGFNGPNGIHRMGQAQQFAGSKKAADSPFAKPSAPDAFVRSGSPLGNELTIGGVKIDLNQKLSEGTMRMLQDPPREFPAV
jgi:hypothetical protein